MVTPTSEDQSTSSLRAVAPVSVASRARSYFASTVGNLLEWFDWAVYAAMSPFIATALFNPANKVSGLLATLAVFAVGFVMRPIGGVVFGFLANRRGRKFVLLVTMIGMAAGTLSIAVIPTYAAIGGWSSFLLVVARLLQGFAHGGETATSYSYVTEVAPSERRGLWSSGVLGCVIAGTILANAVAGTLTAVTSEGFMADGGWRIPFVIGAALGIYALFLRRSMMESDVYERAITSGAGDARSITSLPAWSAGRIVRRSTQLVLYVAGGSVVQYTWTAYAGTYAITQKHMSPSAAYWSLLVAQVVGLAFMPFWGWASDRVGRRPLAIAYGIVFAALVYPAFTIIGSTWWTLAVPATVIFALWGMSGSQSPAVQSENVTTRHRAPVVGAVSSIAAALFGGTAPYLSAYTGSIGAPWAFQVFVIVLCLICAIVGFTLKETKGVDLEKV
ncbi:MFS transporter [Streptomyces sp. NPDC054804]